MIRRLVDEILLKKVAGLLDMNKRYSVVVKVHSLVYDYRVFIENFEVVNCCLNAHSRIYLVVLVCLNFNSAVREPIYLKTQVGTRHSGLHFSTLILPLLS